MIIEFNLKMRSKIKRGEFENVKKQIQRYFPKVKVTEVKKNGL